MIIILNFPLSIALRWIKPYFKVGLGDKTILWYIVINIFTIILPWAYWLIMIIVQMIMLLIPWVQNHYLLCNVVAGCNLKIYNMQCITIVRNYDLSRKKLTSLSINPGVLAQRPVETARAYQATFGGWWSSCTVTVTNSYHGISWLPWSKSWR